MRTMRTAKTSSRLRRFIVETLERRDVPAAFMPGDLVVYRVGDGAAALSSNGNAVFLDEFLPSGAGQTPQQSIALPTTGLDAFTAGTSTLEGFMNLSPDSQFLAITGFNVPLPNGTSITGSTAARVVGVVDKTGTVTFSNFLTDFATGGAPRSSVTVDGKSFWVAGSNTGSYRYVAMPGDTTSTSLTNSPGTPRILQIAGGQLYGSAQSAAFRVFTIGTGLPTVTGQTSTNLPGADIPLLGDPNAMFFADMSISVPGVDTLYVADSTAGVNGGIKKFSFDGTNWNAKGNIQITLAGNNGRAVTGAVNGTNVDIYGSNGTTLFAFQDTSGYNGTITGTPTALATAKTNTAFRGVSFAPRTATSATVTSLVPNTFSTSGPAVTYTETLSAAIAGLTSSNFAITTTGTATGTVGTPTTSNGGLTWSIPVTGVGGLGTIRLDAVNSIGVTPPLTNLPFNGGVVTVAPPGSTLDVSGTAVIFSAGLGDTNDVSLSVSAGTYTISDTQKVINLTANAIAKGWLGNGTKTVTGPDANTSSLLIALGSGTDTFTLNSVNDPLTVTSNGDAGSIGNFAANISFVGAISVTGFDSVTQNNGVLLTVSDLTLGGNTVGTGAIPIHSQATNVTATGGAGGITLAEDDGANFTLSATGIGSIAVVNTTGTLTIAGASTFGSGPVSLSSGDGVAINAALGDLVSSGTVLVAANTDGAGSQGFSMSSAGSIRTLDSTTAAANITVNNGGGGIGDATINNVQVGSTGSVTIDANAGSIFGTAINVIFAGGGFGFLGAVTLKTSSATSAVGTSAQHLSLKTGNIAADAGSGGIFIDNANTNQIKVDHVVAQGTGEILLKRIAGSGNVDISGLVNTGSGNITLQADDNFALLFTGAIGDSNYSGKIVIDVNLDGGNQQTYLGAAGTTVQTKSTASDAVTINISASTNSTAIGGATLSNITVGNGGGITVNAAKLLGDATDTARAGFIEMVDAAAVLNAGTTGIVTLIARDNYIGKSATPIMVTAGTISAVTNSTASVVNGGQGEADVFVTSTGAANFSGTTSDAAPVALPVRVGDITFTTQAGAITLNGDVKTDTGGINLISAAGIDQTGGKVTTLGTATYTYTGLARFSTAGNSAATLTIPALQDLRVDGGLTLSTPIAIDGTLSGSGTLTGTVNVAATGKVAPGTSPGILGTGSITFVSGSQFIAELNGNTAGTNYDRLAVNGQVDLGGATFVGSVGGPIAPGSTLIIIDNDGTSDKVSGQFAGIGDLTKVTIGATTFTVNYNGGDGNDVTFKADGVAATPAKVIPGGVAINSTLLTPVDKAQRARVVDVAITFDSKVSFVGGDINAAAAFSLNRVSPAPGSVTLAASVNNSGPGTVVTLTFTGGAVDSGSLADGRYALHAIASQFTGAGLDGDSNGTGGDDFIFDEPASPATLDPTKLFRIFGDYTGDGSVAANDFIQFRLALGNSAPPFQLFDFDNDGAVAASDFIQFRLRFGGSI